MLDKIEEAKVKLDGIAHQTPVMTSSQLNEISGAEVYLKCENYQRGGAFKFRGGYNAISQLPDKKKEIGVITHSSGNHAQAVAITAKLLKIPAVIVMPNNAPKVKINATKQYGANIEFCEPTQEAREATVEALIEEFGYTLIHPYDNDNIIAGAATASIELFKETGPLDVIMAPVGGGGLICGTALYTKLSKKPTQVIAVEPFGADDAYQSYYSQDHIRTQQPTTIADGLRTTTSERTLNYIRQYVDKIIRVTDNQIIDAVSFLMERMKMVVEPSGATPVAAVLSSDDFQDKRVGIIISGGNLDITSFISGLHPLDI